MNKVANEICKTSKATCALLILTGILCNDRIVLLLLYMRHRASLQYRNYRGIKVKPSVADLEVHIIHLPPYSSFSELKRSHHIYINSHKKTYPFDELYEQKSIPCEKLKHNLKVCHQLRVYHNYKMTATDEIQRLPEDGEVIIATVRQVTGHGAYVTLDEYNNMTGFLHISEIATGWIRNIERYVRPKQKAVLKVIRVNKGRGEVDTSLKQVSGEERKSKLIEVKKSDKAATFLDFIKSKLKLTNEQVQEIEDSLLQKYDYAYDAFEAVSRKGLDAIQNIELSPEIKMAIEEASKRIPIPLVEITGTLEITSKRPDGIEIIKNTLAGAESSKEGVSIIITYIGAPRYRIVVTAENFKIAEKFMNNTVEKIRANIQKQHGTFNFARQDSKKFRTLQQA